MGEFIFEGSKQTKGVITKYNRIKAELAEADKQGRELAAFLGVHVTTVSDWCTNTNQPSVQDLYRVSEFLKVDVRRLLIPTNWDAENSQAAEPTAVFKKTKKKGGGAKKKRK